MTESRLVAEWRMADGGGSQWGTRKLLVVMEMFIISMVVMVSWVQTDVKTYETVHFNLCSLLYINFTSLKLLYTVNQGNVG